MHILWVYGVRKCFGGVQGLWFPLFRAIIASIRERERERERDIYIYMWIYIDMYIL